MALAKNSDEILALEKFEKIVKDLKVDRGTMMRFLRGENICIYMHRKHCRI